MFSKSFQKCVLHGPFGLFPIPHFPLEISLGFYGLYLQILITAASETIYCSGCILLLLLLLFHAHLRIMQALQDITKTAGFEKMLNMLPITQKPVRGFRF